MELTTWIKRLVINVHFKTKLRMQKGSIPRWTSSFIQSFSLTVTSLDGSTEVSWILTAIKTSHNKAKEKPNI